VDQISLTGIELYAYGGVTDEERRIGQRYSVDIELSLDLSSAGRSDDLRDTVSYAEVHRAVIGAMRDRPFSLLEHAATRVSEEILDWFPVQQVSVTLRKLLPPIDGVVTSASVRITRDRTRPTPAAAERDLSDDSLSR
jgi:7,8-dihydroneopterin aldolase/epimerase/oxygenase